MPLSNRHQSSDLLCREEWINKCNLRNSIYYSKAVLMWVIPEFVFSEYFIFKLSNLVQKIGCDSF